MELNLYQCPDPELEKAFEKILLNAKDQGLIKNEPSVSVNFMSPEEIHELNRQYRSIDRTTDVLSFAIQEGDSVLDDEDLGDIFINLKAVEDQAKEYGHTPFREACFLFAHGLLHLLGYDHMEAEEEKEMRELQHLLLDSVAVR